MMTHPPSKNELDRFLPDISMFPLECAKGSMELVKALVMVKPHLDPKLAAVILAMLPATSSAMALSPAVIGSSIASGGGLGKFEVSDYYSLFNLVLQITCTYSIIMLMNLLRDIFRKKYLQEPAPIFVPEVMERPMPILEEVHQILEQVPILEQAPILQEEVPILEAPDEVEVEVVAPPPPPLPLVPRPPVMPRYIILYATPRGDCYHAERGCHYFNNSNIVRELRPCTGCTR